MTEQTAEELDAQQAADLRALELAAAEAGPGPGEPPPEAGQEIPRMDPAESLSGLLQVLGMAAGMARP